MRDLENEIEKRWSALASAAVKLLSQALPGLAAASLQVEAARFAAPSIPRLFSTQLRPLDPSLNEDLLELYGRAERAVSNHFTFFNRHRSFDAEIDWEAPERQAWLSELHSFDYALHLGLTYRISGERRYARHLRYLIAHWIAENPPRRGKSWHLEPLARRTRNWILAADLARGDWENDEDFLAVLGKSLAMQCAELSRLTRSERGPAITSEATRGLAACGRFFGGRTGSELHALALDLLLRAIELRSPSSSEPVPSTPASELSLAATLVEWLMFEGSSPDVELVSQCLHSTLEVLEGILHPDGNLPLIGPATTARLADVAALAAVLLKEPRWKSIAGNFGILPYMFLGEEGKAAFASLEVSPWQPADFFRPRSGWARLCGKDCSALIVNGGASSVGRQGDCSFELSIQGQRVIVGSGPYSGGDESGGSGAGLNCLLLDASDSRHAKPSRGRALAVERDSGPGYFGVHLCFETSRRGELKHRRGWYCLADSAWVILDTLEGRGVHSAAGLLHFFPTFELQILTDRAAVRSRVCELAIIPFGGPQTVLSLSRGDQGEFPAWYAPDHGVRYPTSVLTIRWSKLELPWVGGLVILPGSSAKARVLNPDPATGTVQIELSGQAYRLPCQ